MGGDAAELVRRINHCDFPTAVKYLADLSGMLPSSGEPAVRQPATAASKPASPPPDQPSGLPLAGKASTLVDDAAGCLWGLGGGTALAYLRGRGLTDETIKAAGLGYTPGVMVPTRAGDRAFWFAGIVIPWRSGPRLARIKIRRLDDGKPKYTEAYSDCPLIFPDPAVIRPGWPLIVSESEIDAMLLGQQLP